MDILKYIKKGLCVATALFVAVHTAAQTLPSSGTWSEATISSDETVNLDGDIQLSGTITISNNATLTINNTSEDKRSIANSATAYRQSMFIIQEGAKLVIAGNEKGRIVIDGCAGYSWSDYNLSGGDGNKKLKEVIRSYGTLELKYVTACNAMTVEGFLQIYDLYSDSPQMGKTTIEDCIFEDNNGVGNAGGAILVRGNVPNGKAEDIAIDIKRSTFRHCEGDGGAIRSYGATVNMMTLTDCLFEYNYSRSRGGAILWNAHGKPETKLIVDGCTFRHNKSEREGGAIDVEASYEFVNNLSKIYENEAGTSGGGLAIYGYTNASGNNARGDFEFIVDDYLSIYKNKAEVSGGGIAFIFTGEMTLEDYSTFSFDMLGGLIQNNTAKLNGGGIYFENSVNQKKNYEFTMKQSAGAIQGNTAGKNGGGIYATKFSIIGDETSNSLKILENEAKGNGGAIYLTDGAMEFRSLTVSDNHAVGSNSDGGGIYIDKSDFSMFSGDIKDNSSTYRGGGLFVSNIENNTKHTLRLQDGNISNNDATFAGGGIYVDGYTDISFAGVDIENNTASNGGGIMLMGIDPDKLTSMNYKKGLIRNNRASGEGTSLETAYQKDVEELKGIGGGIFVGKYAGLDFDIQYGNIGIYGNTADIGADDIFASSENSVVDVPDVSSMLLSDYAEAREHTLFWVEDYVTNDLNYDKGTKMKGQQWDSDKTNQRYRAVRDGLVTGAIYQVSAGEYNKYLCLTLGWSSNYITLEKKGMSPKDNAIFKISRKGSDSEYMTVILTDKDAGADGIRRKTIKIEDGEWTIAETSWSWAYTNDPSSITRTLNYYSTPADRTFTFTNTAKEDTPMHSESVKVNELIPE